MPRVCLSAPDLAESRLDQFGISEDDYEEQGTWTSKMANYSHLTENEILKLIETKLSDVVTKVKTKKRVNPKSDKYVDESFKLDQISGGTDINLLNFGYYDYLGGIICFDFLLISFPYGIERLTFYTKNDLKVFLVAPGNFYTFERKRNVLDTRKDFTYRYQVDYVLFLDKEYMAVHVSLRTYTRFTKL